MPVRALRVAVSSAEPLFTSGLDDAWHDGSMVPLPPTLSAEDRLPGAAAHTSAPKAPRASEIWRILLRCMRTPFVWVGGARARSAPASEFQGFNDVQPGARPAASLAVATFCGL